LQQYEAKQKKKYNYIYNFKLSKAKQKMQFESTEIAQVLIFTFMDVHPQM